MRSAIFRSTPFRVTIALGTTFFVAVIFAGLIAFELIERELNQRMDQSILDTFNLISQSYSDTDQADLFDLVTSHARATLSMDRVYAIRGNDGRIVAGNVTVIPDVIGWLTVPKAALGVAADDSGQYRVYVGNVGGNRLLVGSSLAQTTEIANLTLTSVGWASLAILVLVFAIGIVVAIRAQRRIDGIAQTMARVGLGELTARIPLGPRGDDIDLLARQVNAALERLASLVEEMQHVSVNIAHDLKTPLNRLAITLEDAIGADARGAPVAALLAQSVLEIQQISSTFDALLRIAQIEAGARRARFVPVQMEEILGKMSDVYSDVAEEREQKLTVKCASVLPEIKGDRELLTQLCANIIENSLRYGPAETHVEITASGSGDSLVVTFSDDGPGIPEGEHAKVFQRMYRLDMSRSTPGSGLGLSLVKAVVDLHGAEITVGDCNPGLRITIAFPIGHRR